MPHTDDTNKANVVDIVRHKLVSRRWERDKAAVIEDLVTLLPHSLGSTCSRNTLVYTSFSQATEAGKLAMHDDWDLTPASE